MNRKIDWLAAGGWLVTGMAVAFALSLRWTPNMQAEAVASPQAGVPALAANASAATPTGAGGCDARTLSQSFIGVAARLKPAVVTIHVEKKADRRGDGEMGPGGGGPFEDFFRQFQGPGPRGRMGRRPVETGLGSGFVIDKAGHILTNNHVVDGADRVEVYTSDGRKLRGKVIGADKKDDLAVVQVDGLASGPVAFGDSDRLQVGEFVMAIGNPFGIDRTGTEPTVTVGVVSAKGRRLDGTAYAFEDFIQTDAAINHGNSGGPLVNMNGEVVGVNSRIAGEGTGIGFSVSSNVARRIAQALIKEGKVRRPYIGVQLQELTPEMAPQFKAAKGVLVNQVLPSSPADKAGFKVGDVITSVDGREVVRPDDVVRSVQSHQVGQKVDVQLARDGSAKKLSLTTAEAPEDSRSAVARADANDKGGGKYGIRLEDLQPDLARQLGVQARRGAVVADVEPGSAAAHAGLEEGDVIVEVDRKPVGDSGACVSALKGGGTHLLRVEHGKAGSRFVTISPDK